MTINEYILLCRIGVRSSFKPAFFLEEGLCVEEHSSLEHIFSLGAFGERLLGVELPEVKHSRVIHRPTAARTHNKA